MRRTVNYQVLKVDNRSWGAIQEKPFTAITLEHHFGCEKMAKRCTAAVFSRTSLKPIKTAKALWPGLKSELEIAARDSLVGSP